MPPGLSRAVPYAVLLAEVLVFYRRVLFSARYVIPWDLPGYHFPLASFIAKSFRNGELPLWDPYTYCGFPFYANVQAQLFYPPTVVTVLLSNLFGAGKLLRLLEWQIAIHVLLGGVFTYWLLRYLEAGRAAATLGATVFQLGGFFASQTQHLGAINGGAWLPLAWLSLIVLRERITWRWVAILALSLAMTFLAGFPAVTFVVLISSFLLAAMLVVFRKATVKLLGAYALACVWSGMLAAVQLLPTMELTRLSTAPMRGLWGGEGGGVPLQGLVSLVWPNYYSIFDLSKYSLPWNVTFLYLYCSLAGLVLSLAVVLFRKSRWWGVFALVTLVSAFWMLGESTPVGRTFYVHLPVALRSPLYAEFAMLSFLLGMAVLAGLGTQAFVAPRGRLVSALLVAVTALDLLHAGSGRIFSTSRLSENRMVTAGEFEGSRVALTRIREMVNQSVPPARIETVQDSNNWAVGASLTEVPTANGDDPLALVRLLKVRLLFAKGELWNRYYEASRLGSPLVNLLNIRYVLSLAPSDPPPVREAGFRKVEELPGRRIYENPNVLPRFFLVWRVRRVANMEEGLAVMGSPQFDPGAMAVVEGPVDSANFPEAARLKAVKVLHYEPQRVVIETDSPAPAFLVTSETYYPGWRAFVDGEERPLSLTNVAFRGMPVPAGRRRIEMRFEPRILWHGAVISLLAWVMLVGVLSLRRRGPKTRRAPG